MKESALTARKAILFDYCRACDDMRRFTSSHGDAAIMNSHIYAAYDDETLHAAESLQVDSHGHGLRLGFHETPLFGKAEIIIAETGKTRLGYSFMPRTGTAETMDKITRYTTISRYDILSAARDDAVEPAKW